eukprot:Skav234357  [mRNA]  locus=scaffold1274:133242:133466:- [translate_table: standard]
MIWFGTQTWLRSSSTRFNKLMAPEVEAQGDVVEEQQHRAAHHWSKLVARRMNRMNGGILPAKQWEAAITCNHRS